MKHLPSPVPYREDINGLRAWAIIAVLAFHFQLPGMHAGFLGVDIFFVISGFLMTAIIVKGLESGNLSLKKFYMARVRRILPALMVLIVVLLVLGWSFLPLYDYKKLGDQAVNTLFFASNVLFYHQTGYFDAGAHEKWLLHTWSLAIEAQFYVLFPLFLLAIWKFKPQLKSLFFGLGFLFATSLITSIVTTAWNSEAAFYLLPSRAWELAAGGLAFLIGRELQTLKRFANLLLWTGIGLWLTAIIVLNNQTPWPSAWALLPVLGTVSIILAHHPRSRLTVNPVTQWLGDRSYSLYLWHWPIVITLYFMGLQHNPASITSAIAVSLLLAHLSYHLIEVPTRSYLSVKSLRKEVKIIALTVVLIATAAAYVQNYLIEGRMPAEIEQVVNQRHNTYPNLQKCFREKNQANFPPGCVEGGYPPGVILIGDSHSYAVVTALAEASQSFHKGVKYWGITSCPTIKNALYAPNAKMPDIERCKHFNDWVENEIEVLPSNNPLVIVNRSNWYIWGGNEHPDQKNKPRVYFDKIYADSTDITFQRQYRDALISTACDYAQHRQVYLMRPIPEIGINVPLRLSRNLMFGLEDDIKITRDEYRQRNQFVWEAQDLAAKRCGIQILDPLPYLCDEKFCYGSKNKHPLYADDDHLNEYGNKLLVPMFERIFSH